jgi:large conductance mechanosensitive channel
MKKHVAGFMDFVREQGVIGLAIGLAIGTQASEVVKQMVASLVDPIIGLVMGNPKGLQAMEWTLNIGDRSGTFALGKLVYVTIVFLLVAVIIYGVVHGLKLDKLDKKKS